MRAEAPPERRKRTRSRGPDSLRSLSHLLSCSETLLVRDGVARFDDFRPFQRKRMAGFGRDDAFCDPVSKDLLDRLSHGSRSLSRSNQVNTGEII